MGAEKIDYPAVLADMEAKHAALGTAIANLRIFLATQGIEANSASPLPAGSSNGEVPAGAFLGKSIPEAATLFLKIVKRKAKSQEIAEALKRGGMESTSDNFAGIVRAVLDRSRKAGGEIVKLDRSTWGLADWYPAGVRTNVQEKRPKKRRAKLRPAPKVQTQDKPKPAESTNKPGLEHQIEELLLTNRGTVFTGKSVADMLGVSLAAAVLSLGRMAAKGKAERTANGFRAPSDNAEDVRRAS